MSRTTTQGDFWLDRLEVNARQAIFHQWEQLEASGCIENFRIAAGEAEGIREGWFFADSDAYKWLEAASRIWASRQDPRLKALIDAFIKLLGRAQVPDGYLFTYNQVYFPGKRWQNLQIEHELYCHGHLIEAGVSHYQSTGRTDLFDIARRAADRVVADFQGKGPAYTPGHEEIEITLIRLHQVTPGDADYLNLARQFIEQRGRTPLFGLPVIRQFISMSQRGRSVQRWKQAYLTGHPGYQPYALPPDNFSKKPANTMLRWYASALSGQFFQQHVPVREQTAPVGHAVRFAYLQTSTAMLARESGDATLLPALKQSWERMVTRRMYITGGIGSLPEVEGFGKDHELDPETAYAETCAALGSIFWNWEMANLTHEARYSDLLEWQLYNAASVGMGLDGKNYLYNNPLACRSGVTRRSWYAVPCCPSNLSRTFADLGKYVYSVSPGALWVHQYWGSESSNEAIPLEEGGIASMCLQMEAGLPWEGHVRLEVTSTQDDAPAIELRLRQPSWAARMSVAINGEPVLNHDCVEDKGLDSPSGGLAASGYDPRRAVFQPVRHRWAAGDVMDIHFEMPLQLRRADPSIRVYRGQAAVTRGPLVYCLESPDNPGVDIFTARLDPNSLTPVFDTELLDGIVKIQGKTKEGAPLTFIPYFLWSNRGPSQMTVWINV